jgi:hypothetical protein
MPNDNVLHGNPMTGNPRSATRNAWRYFDMSVENNSQESYPRKVRLLEQSHHEILKS